MSLHDGGGNAVTAEVGGAVYTGEVSIFANNIVRVAWDKNGTDLFTSRFALSKWYIWPLVKLSADERRQLLAKRALAELLDHLVLTQPLVVSVEPNNGQ